MVTFTINYIQDGYLTLSLSVKLTTCLCTAGVNCCASIEVHEIVCAMAELTA